MLNIENIKVEKTFYKRLKDFNGNVYREPYQKMVPRKVKTVETGARFGYYIIDSLILLGVNILVGFVSAIMSDYSAEISFGFNIFSYFIQLSYYFLMEGFCGGRTVGKMLLGYVVINEFANQPTTSETALRTICRLIPFEALSCFGERGWHDRFSRTWVVSKSEKEKLQALIGTYHPQHADLLDA